MGLKGLAFSVDPLRPFNFSDTQKWKQEGKSYKLLTPDIEKDKQAFHFGIKEVVVKGGDRSKERVTIRGIANANIIDRVCERLDPRGCKVMDYLKNPQILAHHNYYHPVGQVEILDIQDDGVHFEGWVGDPTRSELTAMQQEMRSLILQNIIKTVSVGFIPKKIRSPQYNDQGDMTEPLVIEEWELLEISLVAVPCNQDSVFGVRGYQAAEELAKLNSKVAEDSDNENDLKESNQEKDLVTCLVFDKDKFNLSSSKEWITVNGYTGLVDIKFCDEFDADFTEEGVSVVAVNTKGAKSDDSAKVEDPAKAEDNSTENFKGEVLTILRAMSETAQKSCDMTEKVYQKICESDSSDSEDDEEKKIETEVIETKEEDPTDVKAFGERLTTLEKTIEDLTTSVKLLVDRLV